MAVSSAGARLGLSSDWKHSQIFSRTTGALQLQHQPHPHTDCGAQWNCRTVYNTLDSAVYWGGVRCDSIQICLLDFTCSVSQRKSVELREIWCHRQSSFVYKFNNNIDVKLWSVSVLQQTHDMCLTYVCVRSITLLLCSIVLPPGHLQDQKSDMLQTACMSLSIRR